MPAAPLTLLAASSNAGKMRDFEAIASRQTARILLQPLPGLDQLPVPIEDADTFAGNAAIKAIAYSLHAPGSLVLADDSGLEVDALAGAPGVHSARYAQLMHFPSRSETPDAYPTTDARNNACLLDALAQQPEKPRTARYRCLLAIARNGILITHAGEPVFGTGFTEGEILAEPRGRGGFGYDPLFLLPNGLTMAEVDQITRLAYSHRARAMEHLLPVVLAALDAT